EQWTPHRRPVEVALPEDMFHHRHVDEVLPEEAPRQRGVDVAVDEAGAGFASGRVGTARGGDDRDPGAADHEQTTETPSGHRLHDRPSTDFEDPPLPPLPRP